MGMANGKCEDADPCVAFLLTMLARRLGFLICHLTFAV